MLAACRNACTGAPPNQRSPSNAGARTNTARFLTQMPVCTRLDFLSASRAGLRRALHTGKNENASRRHVAATSAASHYEGRIKQTCRNLQSPKSALPPYDVLTTGFEIGHAQDASYVASTASWRSDLIASLSSVLELSKESVTIEAVGTENGCYVDCEYWPWATSPAWLCLRQNSTF